MSHGAHHRPKFQKQKRRRRRQAASALRKWTSRATGTRVVTTSTMATPAHPSNWISSESHSESVVHAVRCGAGRNCSGPHVDCRDPPGADTAAGGTRPPAAARAACAAAGGASGPATPGLATHAALRWRLRAQVPRAGRSGAHRVGKRQGGRSRIVRSRKRIEERQKRGNERHQVVQMVGQRSRQKTRCVAGV